MVVARCHCRCMEACRTYGANILPGHAAHATWPKSPDHPDTDTSYGRLTLIHHDSLGMDRMHLPHLRPRDSCNREADGSPTSVKMDR